MVTAKFDKMKDKLSDFLQYIKEKRNIEGKIDGNSVEFTQMSKYELKLLIKKFLHKNGMDQDYRVISKTSSITIVEKKYFKAES